MDTHASRLSPDGQVQAEELLRRAPIAYLAMVAANKPYIVPTNFAYEAVEQAPGR